RPGAPPPDQAQVNKLVLINHSKRPLILLAGEIVTGGKQDRVISKDRIIPPGGDPLPLDVFCVEPGRWHGASAAFTGKSFMAAPNVREKASVAKDQQEVWRANQETRDQTITVLAEEDPAAAPAAREQMGRSSSYAQLENTPEIKRRLDSANDGLQRDYEQALKGALRGKNVVGVVVAINGEVVWADLFADGDLFQRYWPKLLRSYTVEAMSAPGGKGATASVAEAERFLGEQEGKQVIEVEPGEYRLLQVDTTRYTIFQLSSLLEKGEPMLHFNKLRKESWKTGKRRPGPIGPLGVDIQPVPHRD
ncbi:MAG: ARPP-1 family domain-containing protein, partial [Candidatus Acidiferrales bacterium]